MCCRIAISMRVDKAAGYDDPRDCLSQDWARFLKSCDIIPFLVPNIKEGIEDYLRGVDIQGVILSGGNNICPEAYDYHSPDEVSDTAEERDKTEACLIQLAVGRNLPVLGVCRGMHKLNVHFGGKLLPHMEKVIGGAINHVGNDHEIRLFSTRFSSEFKGRKMMVNSFHNQGLTGKEVSPEFDCLALSEQDGVVEGIVHKVLPIVGIQWHPEREHRGREFDQVLLKRLFVENCLKN